MRSLVVALLAIGALGAIAWFATHGALPAPGIDPAFDSGVDTATGSATGSGLAPEPEREGAVDDPERVGVGPTQGSADATVVVGRVVSSARGGVDGASVQLVLSDGGAVIFDGEATSAAWSASVTTDSEGHFRFEHVPGHGRTAGVRVTMDGYAPVKSATRRALPATTLELGELMLRAGGAVSGFVVDEAGERVAGAQIVWTERLGGGSELHRPGARGGRSDEGGAFRVDGLPLGAVRLAAVVDDHVSAWSAPVPVASGREISGLVLRCERGVSLTGRIVDAETGAGVPGTVELSSNYGLRRLSARADAEGHFTLRGLSLSQSYQFQVECIGYAYSTIEGAYGGPNVVTVTEELRASGFEVTVRAFAVRPVRVVDAETDAPIAGAELARPQVLSSVRVRYPPRSPASLVFGRTDRDGRYVPVTRAAEGRVIVQAAEYLPAWTALGRSLPDSADHVVRLERGGSVRARVSGAGAAVQTELFQVPRERAAPYFVPSADNRYLALVARAATEANGIATLAPVAPGDYLVRARATDGRVALAGVALTDEEDEARCELMLVEPARMFGRLPGLRAEVLAVEASGLAFATQTAVDGRWSLEGLVPGEYRVTVSPAGARSARRFPHGEREAWREVGYRVVVSRGQELSVDVPGFGAPAVLEGRAVVNGEPAAFRGLELVWLGGARGREEGILFGRELATAVTDGDGRFRVDELEAGHWQVRLVARIEATKTVALATIELDLVAGATRTCELAASAGGLVIDAGTGWIGVDVSTPPGVSSERVRHNLMLPGSGKLHIEAFPAGHYQLTSHRREGDPIAFDVAPGVVNTVRFQVDR